LAEVIKAAAQAARKAALQLSQASHEARNNALEAIAGALTAQSDKILEANARDVKAAEAMVAVGKLGMPLLKRLKVDDAKLRDEMVVGIRSVASQEDPIGKTLAATELDQGLNLFRVSVPIGVIGVVFESRPDALVQIACLCLKSGNAVMLKGGSEALHTNRALAEVMIAATADLPGMPPGWMHLLEAREDVTEILALHNLIDLIIPRGSNDLVQHIMSHTKIPVMGHADGICHVYVDRDADLAQARRIVMDSKTQYVSVCNAAETLLVHRDIAPAFLPDMICAFQEAGVEVRGDTAVAHFGLGVVSATEADWATEYLDMIISVRVVDDLEAAIDHINTYSSHHTDAIITRDPVAASRFLRGVDSASVMHNASTRFADGYRYGLGAEVGISTVRLHSRGPVGLEGLVIYKYVVEGQGQIVSDYSGQDGKKFTHRKLDAVWAPKQ
jgi:glutamate-5-semialdehyde dehydrogenase